MKNRHIGVEKGNTGLKKGKDKISSTFIQKKLSTLMDHFRGNLTM